MSRWWKSERSLAASRVRATRKRLRAGYRNSLRAAVALAESAADQRARAAEQRARNETERICATERDLLAIVERLNRVRVSMIPSDPHLLRVEVAVSREAMIRSTGGFAHALAQQLGRAVENAVVERWEAENYGKHTTRISAPESLASVDGGGR